MKFRTDIYGIIVDVEYTYHHAYRGQRDGNVGPPLEPDEPRHCEIDSVTTRLGEDITDILSDKIIRQLELEAEEVYFNVEE